MVGTIGLPEKELKQREALADTVHCFRCMGFMVVEQGVDSTFGRREADVAFRRCVQCGEILDPVILQNRRWQVGGDLVERRSDWLTERVQASESTRLMEKSVRRLVFSNEC